jgi:hypothetical protein
MLQGAGASMRALRDMSVKYSILHK